jgi:sterol 24-C-methyltransferase
VTTDKFDAANPAHAKLKKEIEVGDGLPDITNWRGVRDALVGAGFEVEAVTDLAETSPVAWWEPFKAAWTLTGFKSTWVGFTLTHVMTVVLEALWLSPKGTAQMHSHLMAAARGLSAGGDTGTFTPMLFFKARKPNGVIEAAAAAAAAPAAKATARGRSKSKAAR